MNVRVRLLALSVLVALVPASGLAGPVEITDERETDDRVRGACASWVEPAGDDYEWTNLCVSERAGDGGIIERRAYVQKSICDEDGSTGGTVCWTEAPLFEDDVAPDEMFIAGDYSSAWLASDLAGCRIDLTWTATSEKQTWSGQDMPDPVLRIEPIRVGYQRQAYSFEFRDGTAAGSVCAEADVSGEPRWVWIGSFETSRERKHITINL